MTLVDKQRPASHFAKCGCGWTGRRFEHAGVAIAEGQLHMGEAHPQPGITIEDSTEAPEES